MFIGIDLSLTGLSVRGGGGGSGAATFDYYVDSVGGSDSNDGTSAAQAKQTIAAAVALLSDGDSLGLARGSHWRETLTVADDDITIGVYGTGDMPILDGADAAPSGWTQPDSVTYPNVWSRSWSRSQAPTTGEAKMGAWINGVHTTRQTSLANLQAGSNGDWHTTNLTAQNSTISVRSAADPNSDGITREFTKRSYGINAHGATNGAAPTGLSIEGPIELKRFGEHYNALSMGPGLASKVLLRDGNIHHSVSEGDQTDVIATEFLPNESAPSVIACYRATSSGFNPVLTRWFSLLPGGASRRQDASAFYAHGGSGKIGSLTLNACISKGGSFVNSDADLMTISGGYGEDPPDRFVNFGATDNIVSHLLLRETAASPYSSSNCLFFTPSVVADATVSQVCAYSPSGRRGVVQTNTTHRHSYSHCSFVVVGQTGMDGAANTVAPDVTYCIIQSGRNYNAFSTSYTGDWNVFYFVNQANPQFHYNGSVYGTLADFQAASGQDANSVYLKHADQAGANAFWYGIANSINAGPADGDFRINPNAWVYNGAGTKFTGTYPDGVTPLVGNAGATEHWDFNTRAVASGPATQWPTLPATVAEMRTYLEDPEAWDFYP